MEGGVVIGVVIVVVAVLSVICCGPQCCNKCSISCCMLCCYCSCCINRSFFDNLVSNISETDITIVVTAAVDMSPWQ